MARRFTFRLQSLLKTRQQSEAIAKQAFYQARGEVDVLRLEIEKLDKSLAQYNRFARNVIAGANGVVDLGIYREMIDEIDRSLKQKKAQLESANLIAEQNRKQWLSAMKQMKAVSRLREKLAARYAAKVRQSHVKELDEIYATQSTLEMGR